MRNARLVLVGAGALAREIINWMADISSQQGWPKVEGFLDQSEGALSSYDYGLKYLGQIETYVPREEDRLILCIGEPLNKRNVVEGLKKRGGVFLTIVHPTAVIARSAELGEGVVVCPNSLISADSKLGNFVTVNVLSSVGHDVKVGDFTTLSAHVDLTGWVLVEEECFFGAGAKVLPRVKIGAKSRVGAGTVIMRNLKTQTTMYCPPSKRLK